MRDEPEGVSEDAEREQWMRRYISYLSYLGWEPYELECMAYNAWESWPDDDPEEVASSDLHCVRGHQP